MISQLYRRVVSSKFGGDFHRVAYSGGLLRSDGSDGRRILSFSGLRRRVLCGLIVVHRLQGVLFRTHRKRRLPIRVLAFETMTVHRDAHLLNLFDHGEASAKQALNVSLIGVAHLSKLVELAAEINRCNAVSEGDPLNLRIGREHLTVLIHRELNGVSHRSLAVFQRSGITLGNARRSD